MVKNCDQSLKIAARPVGLISTIFSSPVYVSTGSFSKQLLVIEPTRPVASGSIFIIILFMSRILFAAIDCLDGIKEYYYTSDSLSKI